MIGNESPKLFFVHEHQDAMICYFVIIEAKYILVLQFEEQHCRHGLGIVREEDTKAGTVNAIKQAVGS